MTEDVLTSLRGAVAALPDDIALRLHLAELLLVGGESSEAVQHTAVVLEHDPDNADALSLMTRALRREPKREEPAQRADEPAPMPGTVLEAEDDLRDQVAFDWRAAEAQAERALIARLWIGLIVTHVVVIGGFIYARLTSGHVPMRLVAVVLLVAAVGFGAWRLSRPQADVERQALTDAVRSDPPIMSGVVTASIGVVLMAVSLCTGGLVETDAELAGVATVVLGLALLITLASASRQPA